MILVAAIQAASERDLPSRVNAAIERGAAWLRAKQRPDGTWDDGHNSEFASGVAALGFLTLVKSGVGESDPAVQRCIRYFDDYRAFEKTYSTGVLVLAWEALRRGDADRPKAAAAATWLMAHRDPATKLWAYPKGEVDLSNTQYALLGLLAASRMGVDVPKEFLFESLTAVVKRQQREHSFTYKDPSDVPTGSMTTAGILAFRIAAMQLKGFGPYEAVRREWEDRENAAFGWLDTHFRVDVNPAGYTPKGGMRPFHHYYLYGLERICTLAGKRKLGNRDWYVEGAVQLVESQDDSGAWKSDFVDTCFALLFLKRATLTWSPDLAPAGETATYPAARFRPARPDPKVPFIRSWLVCGPFVTKTTDPLSKDEIGETAIKAAADGDRAGNSTRRWKRMDVAENVLDFAKALTPFDGAFAYAFATVHASSDQDAVVWIGHDDGAKVWINGKLVYENESYGEAASADTYWASVKLKKGANALLVKVYNRNYSCGLCVRFTTPTGEPIR